MIGGYDRKGRGPAYRRGNADGRLEQRADDSATPHVEIRVAGRRPTLTWRAADGTSEGEIPLLALLAGVALTVHRDGHVAWNTTGPAPYGLGWCGQFPAPPGERSP